MRQIHFVFIKFHKASRQTTRLYFPFSRLGRHSAEGECRGKWRTRGQRGDYVGPFAMSFLLPPPFSRSSFPFLPVIFLYQRTCGSPLFLSLPASQRELGVTIQSSCFTFKSSCRAAISNHVRGMACVHVHYDHPRSTIFHGRAVRCCRPARSFRSRESGRFASM